MFYIWKFSMLVGLTEKGTSEADKILNCILYWILKHNDTDSTNNLVSAEKKLLIESFDVLLSPSHDIINVVE